MKKVSAKNTPAAKPVKEKTKAAPKKAEVKKPATKKVPAKKTCGKSDCKCKASPEIGCFDALITEIFTQLQDTQNLTNLLKDFFYTELLKRGIEDRMANTLANKLEITVEGFGANISFKDE